MNLNVAVSDVPCGTSINDVQVPDRLRERYLSGIDWFDEAIGGGLVPSTAMLIAGAPGIGKSTFIRQVANAYSSKGVICLYNSGEESAYQIKMSVERLQLQHDFPLGQEALVDNVLGWASDVQKKNPRKQIILLQDSLQTLNDGKYRDGAITSGTIMRTARAVTNWCKQTFGICIMLGQVRKDGKFAGPNAVKHAFDTHIEFGFDNKPRSETFGERLFDVVKNRFGPSGRVYMLGMGDAGLYQRGFFETYSPEKL